MTSPLHSWLDQRPTAEQAYALLDHTDWRALAPLAGELRERGWGTRISYSRKVFVPLTQLCRDVCHYCTFAQTPRHLDKPYLEPDDVLRIARDGAALGCKEVLFTLGDRPEARYARAREALATLGFATTLDYLEHIAGRVVRETGLLPHLNPGLMNADDLARLRKVAPSMGIMLESSSDRLCQRGGPHFGSPDKVPARRLDTLRLAGEARVPMTSGILIGIGETRRERLDSLLALRDLSDRYGHLQEIIVQNFRAKPGTKMHAAPEPSMDELCWTIAAARLIFGAHMSIQAPPNLYGGDLPELIAAGINDWGGVSPLTPDHVNPEAPWPHLDRLAQDTARAGCDLVERLTVYPAHVRSRNEWIAPELHASVLRLSDGAGWARVGRWTAGSTEPADADDTRDVPLAALPRRSTLSALIERAADGLAEREIAELFTARGADFVHLCRAADELRQQTVGNTVSYAVVRNINYTNICLYKCSFCAFSKGKTHDHLRGAPYLVDLNEIRRRVGEAWERGGTEVCMQGGIHPSFTGETYLDIARAAKQAQPRIHVHAFSPLEVAHGARTLGISIDEFLVELKRAGVDSLPGTAAEILDDDIRRELAPDKLDTQEWLDVVARAHRAGIATTSTIMYGSIEGYEHWARHLLRLRELQQDTGGLTEFVPLPFVHMEAPMYLRGRARRGPTLREAILMHAVARLVLHPFVRNIQASWVKLGPQWAQRCLTSGANDLGGTLMNESISRAAGAVHGEEFPPQKMQELIAALDRPWRQRTTLYRDVDADRIAHAATAAPLAPTRNAPLARRTASATA
ncbi:MAG TPA: 5-amino-6-(D-ribitylamino)uracil--L-tyrosine 4-hydroxyphenyl transferase CofH [Povalibacter sp.]|uniref:5-amino-6-(D-ribitylamino)uracil--L-tyrosine 4-hydroxyphenyl transferase CofH n=1 Tax=Povalibacter sp. TaxID=1962978 RepID=UPI002C82926B|nr:5-amino-6-(D-ribitylamino)uracil--L-tyrosine 4-hydroxyphenyl transferase CofH [Povalibacter sp.]HMN46878.1 5-amino-6-(D-ribitylamino)uracil--L-tyrosine 4-hydroxyphenyl transferase CofH [Povalibacter sp.]